MHAQVGFHRFGADEAIEAKKVVLDISAENQRISQNYVMLRFTHINMCIPTNSDLTIKNNLTI